MVRLDDDIALTLHAVMVTLKRQCPDEWARIGVEAEGSLRHLEEARAPGMPDATFIERVVAVINSVHVRATIGRQQLKDLYTAALLPAERDAILEKLKQTKPLCANCGVEIHAQEIVTVANDGALLVYCARCITPRFVRCGSCRSKVAYISAKVRAVIERTVQSTQCEDCVNIAAGRKAGEHADVRVNQAERPGGIILGGRPAGVRAVPLDEEGRLRAWVANFAPNANHPPGDAGHPGAPVNQQRGLPEELPDNGGDREDGE